MKRPTRLTFQAPVSAHDDVRASEKGPATSTTRTLKEVAKLLATVANQLNGVEQAKQDGSQLLTVKEVAARLRVTPDCIYRLSRRGEIPSLRFGRKVRFKAADLDEFLNSQRQERRL